MQENQFSKFLTRSDTNWPVELQMKVRGLNFRVKEWHCTIHIVKTKILSCYCTADLRFCFHTCKMLGFS